jgi:hypothetical protein
MQNQEAEKLRQKKCILDSRIEGLLYTVDLLKDRLYDLHQEKYVVNEQLNKELDKICEHKYETIQSGYNNDDYVRQCKLCGRRT